MDETEKVQDLPPQRKVEEGDPCVGELCVVCQTSLVAGDETRALHCGHTNWHEGCLLQWLSQRRSCPICRAPAPGFDSEGEGGSDEWSEDTSVRLQHVWERLENQMTDLSEALDAQIRLQCLREQLASRMIELERERIQLEMQVQQIGVELASFSTNLLRLQTERYVYGEALRRERAAQASILRCSVDQIQDSAHEQCSSHDGSLDESEHTNIDLTSSLDSSPMPLVSETDAEKDAKDMLQRLRGAILRTPLPAAEVFRVLAARTGRLDVDEAKRLLRALEAAVSNAVLSRAFDILDVDGSGFVEESDWMAALQLPSMETSEFSKAWTDRVLSRYQSPIS
eukprot:TRINITY_DN3384_c2_g2_i1.p1 TRINITY_DN3384_c2_g2~~TRINITY_DN3384_c2_g2_i1.p1  ORF type:complete len:340 (+),score=62.15 TRINITY_DN3384_c2_g2_i1:84-1103(+)